MKFEAVARGIYLEGLCTEENTVWVSDPVTGGVRRIRADGAAQTFLPEKLWIGGLMPNGDGRILVSGEGGVVWLDGATGASGVLFDTCDGVPLLGVNEMAADDEGGLYFGSLDVPAIAKGAAPGPVAIYRLGPDGMVRKVSTDVRFCNGIAISADGKKLFLNETFVGTSVFDILPDKTLGPQKMLLKKPDCDGLALDSEGTLWITGFATSGITLLSPDGAPKGMVEIPGAGATQIRFAGADWRDFYITVVSPDAADKLKAGLAPTDETSVLYRGRSEVPGAVYRPARRPIPAA